LAFPFLLRRGFSDSEWGQPFFFTLAEKVAWLSDGAPPAERPPTPDFFSRKPHWRGILPPYWKLRLPRKRPTWIEAMARTLSSRPFSSLFRIPSELLA